MMAEHYEVIFLELLEVEMVHCCDDPDGELHEVEEFEGRRVGFSEVCCYGKVRCNVRFVVRVKVLYSVDTAPFHSSHCNVN